MSSTVAEILRRAVDGRRLGFDEGVELFRSTSLLELGRAAAAVCRCRRMLPVTSRVGVTPCAASTSPTTPDCSSPAGERLS